jgi:hypothetical protein
MDVTIAATIGGSDRSIACRSCLRLERWNRPAIDQHLGRTDKDTASSLRGSLPKYCSVDIVDGDHAYADAGGFGTNAPI